MAEGKKDFSRKGGYRGGFGIRRLPIPPTPLLPYSPTPLLPLLPLLSHRYSLSGKGYLSQLMPDETNY